MDYHGISQDGKSASCCTMSIPASLPSARKPMSPAKVMTGPFKHVQQCCSAHFEACSTSGHVKAAPTLRIGELLNGNGGKLDDGLGHLSSRLFLDVAGTADAHTGASAISLVYARSARHTMARTISFGTAAMAMYKCVIPSGSCEADSEAASVAACLKLQKRAVQGPNLFNLSEFFALQTIGAANGRHASRMRCALRLNRDPCNILGISTFVFTRQCMPTIHMFSLSGITYPSSWASQVLRHTNT